jgi:hypothetical protein
MLLLGQDEGQGEEEAAERVAARWAHRHAAALWATVFRACTDTTITATSQQPSFSSSSSLSSWSAACGFEEAFLAMRAEMRVGAELEELLAGAAEATAAPAGGRGK